MKVDPRIVRRRLEVAEQQALSRVRRSLVLLVVLVGAGCVALFSVSSHMRVRSVTVEGATQPVVDEILAREKVVEGRPVIAIRAASLEDELEASPWIESASVKIVFPTEVEVHVQERVAVAWIRLDDRWGLLAGDGVVIDYAESPIPARSFIQVPVDDPGLGGMVRNQDVLGALRFLAALPEDLTGRSVVRVSDEELWASVSYRTVRLGRPVDMEAKAESLMAVIETDRDGVIDVTAPSRPAIRPSGTAAAEPAGGAYL